MSDLSLVYEFVQEAREYIDEVEPTLIEIYNDSDALGAIDPELINSVFRLFHSMKGSAGFLALTTIASVTHEAETLLDKIRNGKIHLTVEMTETLCKTLDLFRTMLDHIAETGNDHGFDTEAAALIENLKTHYSGTAPSSKKADSEPAASAPKTAAPAEKTQESPPETPAEVKKSVPAESPTPEPTVSNVQISPELRLGFVQEGNEQIDGIEQALLRALEDKTESADENLKEAFRFIHSFKGNCGFMGFVDLEHLSHTMETYMDLLHSGTLPQTDDNVSVMLKLLDVLREGVGSIEAGGSGNIKGCDLYVSMLSDIMGTQEKPPSEESASAPPAESMPENAPPVEAVQEAKEETDLKSQAVPPVSTGNTATPKPAASPAAAKVIKQDIRVDLHKLDALINLIGELVIAESMVTRCPAVSHVEDDYYNRAKHQLRRICDDLKDVAMSVRMIPLSATFRKMVRLVHDLATKSGKKIKLNLVGEETEVDKTVIEQIADPLVHIVRNSCDHGIETPEDRIAAGKNEVGNVTLEGRHEGGEVWILISDDGHGLNRDRILTKALEKGIVSPDAKDWPDERIYRIVFEAGFSTAEKITDISGRGVGMDVVRKNIEKLNGRIDIQSRPGQGSVFTLRIPLTLAIIDAMLVRVGTAKYMLPTLAIRESLVPTKKQVTITPDGKEILRLREEMIPIIRLYDIFAQEPQSERLKDGILIVAEDGSRSFAIYVDEIIGQQQTVIKGLPDYIGKADGFSGCTILGDGSVSLIIDVGTICQKTGTFAASSCDKDSYWEDVHDRKMDSPHFQGLSADSLKEMDAEEIPWEMFEQSVNEAVSQANTMA
ncbi:MAG: chemotaxis protein CheA [Planctomycetaceae bacterium]|jgi:two-component system chemotaxis sensor kinase CheA|nr:chemotaxis protein CheA [Planctomycetaceae bacterium]